MTSLTGRINKTRRRSYPLKRFRRRIPRAARIVDGASARAAGVVVVREYRRDPNWTEWTFVPTWRVAGNVDIVELLGRDNDDPIVPGSA